MKVETEFDDDVKVEPGFDDEAKLEMCWVETEDPADSESVDLGFG